MIIIVCVSFRKCLVKILIKHFIFWMPVKSLFGLMQYCI